MDKFEDINELIPFYKDLLTDKQADILTQYYFEDFSLSEIAENLEISRNAVHDSLKKSVSALNKYEDILGLHKDYLARVQLYSELESLNIDKVNIIVEKLKKMEE